MSISHRDVAQAFADGKTKGSGSRMFISDDTIYSHGLHYPIAKRYFKHGVDYLFNTPYGSVSTSSHMSHVRQAIEGSTVLVVEGCDIDNAGSQFRRNTRDVEKYEGKLKRARKDGWKEHWESRIEELEAQNEMLAQVAVRQRLLEAAEREKDER